MNQILPYFINEYFYCKNNLFLQYYNIIQNENQFIKLGNYYDKENNKNKIKILNFEIDEIDKKRKLIIEKKKTLKTNFDGNKYQLLYYLYLTKTIYKNYNGLLIDIENKKEYFINYQIEKENLKDILVKIKEFLDNPIFNNNLINIDKCKNCNFFEFCII